jgi:hypothetical protein
VKYVYADNYEGSPINVMIAQKEWGEQEIPLGMLKLSMTLTQGSTEYNKPLRIPSMTSNVNSLLTSRGSLHCGDGQSSGYPKPLKSTQQQHSMNLASRKNVTKSKSENPANQLTVPSSKISCQQHAHEILMSI